MKESLANTRNIGFIAHIDAGKTTTTERVLFYSGRNYKMGEVHDGTTTTDWMIQEKERGITITSAATYCQWKDCHINIIDTPGHIDFTVEVERSLKVLDGVIVIFCAVGGVQPQSETVWHQADKYGIPRIAFINKLDRPGADFLAVIKEMREKLGTAISAVQLPIYDNEELIGIIDLVKNQAVFYQDDLGVKLIFKDIPQEYQQIAAKQRELLWEKLAELDDAFMAKLLDNHNFSLEEIKALIRKLVLENKFIPVLGGTALKNKGVQLMLDAVCDYLPSPQDLGEISGQDLSGKASLKRKLSINEPFCGLCFKVATDAYVGKIFYVRIYSGKISAADTVYNATKKSKEKITKILRMHANKQEAISEAKAGDIICFVGLKDTTTGDTLCEQNKPILLEEIKFPEPVVSVAVEPKSMSDQEKLFSALQKLSDEDPSFRVLYNKETGQNIISGMGQLHLEIMVDRVKREFGVTAHTGKPQVAYKETITKESEAVGKFIQQTGGRGQYGHVVFLMKPLEKGAGIVFENKLKGGAIPKEFVPSVKEGVLEAAENGVLGGFPTVDIKVTLIDGSYHDVDSSELAFKVAAEMAFRDGLRKSNPVILEPIMELEVITPEEYVSQVIGDLNSRRAQISGISERKLLKIVKAELPLAEVFNYADILRSLTQGRASYTIEPSYYSVIPDELLVKILGR